jgi:hypothetical protein
MTEQQVIEQLQSYRQKEARMKVLSTYSVGAGIQISRLNEDDQLQDLHRRLRGLPSYMYLSRRELVLESTAHAYLGGRYPAGVKRQQEAIPAVGADIEDDKLLRQLRAKLAKVIAARGYDVRDDIDEVLNRLARFQDLQAEIGRIDTALKALEAYKPDYAKLLRFRYVEDMSPTETANEMGISIRTFDRRRPLAIAEYIKLS